MTQKLHFGWNDRPKVAERQLFKSGQISVEHICGKGKPYSLLPEENASKSHPLRP